MQKHKVHILPPSGTGHVGHMDVAKQPALTAAARVRHKMW